MRPAGHQTPRRRRPPRWLGLLAAAALLGGLGLRLLEDRRGLTVEAYGAMGIARAPYFAETAETIRLDRDSYPAVRSPVFTLRWRGWLWVEKAGTYGFQTRSSGESLVRLGEETVVRNPGGVPPPAVAGALELAPGLHPVEIVTARQPGQWRWHETRWSAGGGPWEEIPAGLLFDARPGPLRRALRRATGDLGFAGRRGLAAMLLLASVLAAWAALRPRAAALGRFRRTLAGRPVGRLAGGLGLLLLAVLAWRAADAVAGSPYGYDDLRYMEAARETQPEGWILNRFAHIYLLKPIFAIAGGDVFAGSELYWTLMFTVTIVAMALSVRSLGPSLQLPTLAASLALLLSQPVYFERVGGAFADYSAGLFVTLGVAAYLLGLGARETRWRYAAAFALGLLTLWGVRSKELAAVLLYLVPLLAFESGRLRWRPFAAKLSFWLAGLALGQAALMTLDAVFLGDFFFSVRAESWAEVGSFNLGGPPQIPRREHGWIETLLRGMRQNEGDASGALLGLAVLLAAAAAAWRRRRIELRLLHLMPVAYLVMLMLVHVRGNYIFSTRYLYPILPVSCVLAATLLRNAGGDRLDTRRLLSPRFFVPAATVGVFVALFVLPVVARAPGAEGLLPMEWLTAAGWEAGQHFTWRVLAPVLVLATLSLLCIYLRDRELRAALLLLTAVLLLAPYARQTIWLLKTRQAVQRADGYLYPFRVFENELAPGEGLVVVSPDLMRLRMCSPGPTCARIARLSLGIWSVASKSGYDPEAAAHLATREDLAGWRRENPDRPLEVIYDPTGLVAVVRPAESRPEAGRPPAPFGTVR